MSLTHLTKKEYLWHMTNMTKEQTENWHAVFIAVKQARENGSDSITLTQLAAAIAGALVDDAERKFLAKELMEHAEIYS